MKTLGQGLKNLLFLIALLVSVNSFAGVPDWVRVNYTNSTIFIGDIHINEYNSLYTVAPPTVEAGDYIGAFVDGECRMVAEIFEHEGTLYVSALIHGGEMESMLPGGPPIPEDEIEFRLWDFSSDQDIEILGTTFFNQEGQIGSSDNLFPIGAPNTDKSLESLTINGVSLNPSFSPTTTSYTVDGNTIPSQGDYSFVLADSRAESSVSYASDASNNVTTITVTAEDGTSQNYTITFSVEVILDYTALNNKITEAQTLSTGADAGSAVGDYPQSAITALDQAIASAITVRDNATEQSEINAATATLDQAIQDFLAQQIPDVITGISIVESERNLLVSGTFTPTVTYLPEGVTIQPVSWSSSNSSIASVNASNGLITGVAVGTGVIITATYGTFSDQITINVTQEVVLVYTDLDNLISQAQTLVSTATIGTAVGNHSQADVNTLSTVITTVQSLRDAATTQTDIDDAIDIITAAILAFHASAVPDVVTGFAITSADRTMSISDSFIPTVSFSPTGVTPETILWTATNSSLVSINQTTGEITAVAAGVVVVTASVTADGNTYSDFITLTIENDPVTEITVESVTVKANGMIAIDLGATIDVLSAGTAGDITIKINGTEATITLVATDVTDGEVILVSTAETITSSDNVTVSYVNNSHVTTTSGAELASFTDVAATNNVPTSIEDIDSSTIIVSQTGNDIIISANEIIDEIILNNISGQVVLKTTPLQNSYVIKDADLSIGVYVITVFAGNDIKAAKVVIK